MEYLSWSRRSMTLSNEPLVISSDDLMQMHLQNQRDAAECRAVTESSNRGESYYAGDGRPGNDKTADFMTAFFREVLYRDVKTAGFMMEYPHGIVISQGERNSYYRGENQIFSKSQPSLYRRMEQFSSQSANSHFLRTAGPHFPDSPGHIKRTTWDISRAEGTPPY